MRIMLTGTLVTGDEKDSYLYAGEAEGGSTRTERGWESAHRDEGSGVKGFMRYAQLRLTVRLKLAPPGRSGSRRPCQDAIS